MLLFDDSKRLEKALGEEAASAIAHVLERADEKWRRELATKADLQEVRTDLIERIAATENRLIRWMVGGFIVQATLLVAVLGIAAMAFLR